MKTLFTIFSLAIAANAWALDIEITPGTLADKIDDASSVTTLTVTGTADASDLFYIADNMPALTALDLSGVQIVEYYGVDIHNYSSYPGATIPACTFAGSSLQSVVLPAQSGLTIRDAAFAGSHLTAVEVPSNVTTMGVGVFAGCPSLQSATVSGALGTHTFNSCPALEQVTLQGVTTIGDGAFASCPVLATIDGSTDVTAIGSSAFKGCSGLQTFAFGPQLKSLGEEAFAYSGLTSADLSNSPLTTIGAYALAHCPALTEVILPDGVNLSQGIFFDDSALAAVALPAELNELPDYAFKGTVAWNPNVLPQSVETIGDYALTGMNHIAVFNLPADVAYIGTGAMEGWTALKELDASRLTDVPELGDDVWAGVDQPNVTLNVSDALKNSFATTPQWMEFKIPGLTGNVDITPDAKHGVKAWFDGHVLRVEATEPIATVTLIGINGQTLTEVRPATETASIDTAPFSDVFYVVRVSTAEGSVATLKLARR